MTSTTDTEKETCGECGRAFDTLAEVFSHDCVGFAARHTMEREASPLARGPRATDKQVAFLVRLGVAEADAEAMSKSTASETIDRLLKAQGPPPMSERQESFLRSLLAQKTPDADADEIVATLNTLPNPASGASSMIDILKQQPNAVKVSHIEPTKPELVKGDVHVVNGEYYRVHQAQGSGNLYACKWDGTRFDYDRGAISKLNPDNKITAEQAAEFGHMFERCCFCSTPIDTPESTEVGYGPVCASKHGLPWGA